MSLKVSKTGATSFRCEFRVRYNPTAGSIEFGVSTSKGTPPTDWGDGSWSGYEALVGKAWANTPTVGGASADVDVSGFEAGRLVLWYRLTFGSEIDEFPYDEELITLIN